MDFERNILVNCFYKMEYIMSLHAKERIERRKISMDV